MAQGDQLGALWWPRRVVTNNWADLPVLCGCFPLAIYFTFGSVFMSMPPSHFVPAYPSPTPYPQVHSLVGLCLYSRLAPRFFWNFRFYFFIFLFFRFHIYVLPYGISFSLSDLPHSVWQSLVPPTSLQITQFLSLLRLSNIPLYVHTTFFLSIHPLMDIFWLLQIILL